MHPAHGQKVLFLSSPDHICWGSSTFIFSSRTPDFVQTFHKPGFRLLWSAGELILTVLFALLLHSLPFSAIQILHTWLWEHKPTYSQKLRYITMHPNAKWKKNILHTLCAELEKIWLCQRAGPYPVPSFTRITFSKVSIEQCFWHIRESKTWKRFLHVGNLSILERSEVLTRPASLIQRENYTYTSSCSSIACYVLYRRIVSHFLDAGAMFIPVHSYDKAFWKEIFNISGHVRFGNVR